MEKLVLQAKRGMEFTEGTNITVKDATFITTETNPVMQVHNSNSITFDNIKYTNGSEILLAVYGEKTSNIKLLNTDASRAKQKVEFNFGAKQSVLIEK